MHKHKKKINRHEIMNQVFLSGKAKSPEEIKEHMRHNDMGHLIYRIATYIYNCRKDGAIIKVYKEGKNVTAYQLINYKEFNEDGRWVGEVKQRGSVEVETV
jgi:hypothetical protein